MSQYFVQNRGKMNSRGEKMHTIGLVLEYTQNFLPLIVKVQNNPGTSPSANTLFIHSSLSPLSIGHFWEEDKDLLKNSRQLDGWKGEGVGTLQQQDNAQYQINIGKAVSDQKLFRFYWCSEVFWLWGRELYMLLWFDPMGLHKSCLTLSKTVPGSECDPQVTGAWLIIQLCCLVTTESNIRCPTSFFFVAVGTVKGRGGTTSPAGVFRPPQGILSQSPVVFLLVDRHTRLALLGNAPSPPTNTI